MGKKLPRLQTLIGLDQLESEFQEKSGDTASNTLKESVRSLTHQRVMSMVTGKPPHGKVCAGMIRNRKRERANKGNPSYQGKFRIPMTEEMFATIFELFDAVDLDDPHHPSVAMSTYLLSLSIDITLPELAPILAQLEAGKYIQKQIIATGEETRSYFEISEHGIETLKGSFPALTKQRDGALSRMSWLGCGLPKTVRYYGVRIYNIDLQPEA